VNPLQFDRQDDLERYPRTLDADLRICTGLGVELVFAPPVEEMYPVQTLCSVTVKRMADGLCGRFRPGHFDGVATVVTKLFDILQPEVAYFGEKDAQQLAVVRRMVLDLNIPVAIVGVATVREADGLALSSRNLRLSSDERTKATALYRALRQAEQAIASGERDARTVERLAAAVIPSDASLRLEYLEVVDPVELQRVDTIAGSVLLAGALWVGNTRLIDNIST
jgi:pantoate--beta-alanine ligase